MKTNQSTAKEATKSNVLQADPVLLSALCELTKCRASIFNYGQKHGDEHPFLGDSADDFDGEIFACISRIGDMIGYQVVCESQKLADDE